MFIGILLLLKERRDGAGEGTVAGSREWSLPGLNQCAVRAGMIPRMDEMRFVVNDDYAVSALE